MAVKTWSAGEVLTAVDLNDTIADAKASGGGSNLLYNGAMQVAQRGTSSTGITSSGYYTADRWKYQETGTTPAVWTNSIETDGPTGSGFTKSLKILCTTADASPAANGVYWIRQLLEGQDLQRIAKGTASAQKVTISFWVKSNATGTYIVNLYDADNNRQIAASYTVDASATWEQKSVTFLEDTTGAFSNSNTGSLVVNFVLAAGSDSTSGTLATSWASYVQANSAVGQTNLAAAVNNYWQVTGVQLEVGDTASDFEHLPFGVELARCQRYYQKSYPYGTAPGSAVGLSAGLKFYQPTTAGFQATVNIQFKQTMRASPTVTFYNPNTGATGQALVDTGGTVTPATTYISDSFAAAYIVGAATWANAYTAYTAASEL